MSLVGNYDLPPDVIHNITQRGVFIAIVFVRPRSPHWEKVNYLMQCADEYFSDGETTFGFFKKTARSVQVAYEVLSLSRGWKSCYVFMQGVPVFSLKDIKWLECYMRSLRADDLRAYCTIVDRPRSPFTPGLEVEKYISPCRFITYGWWFNPDHPSDYVAQFQAQAVRMGVNQCPNCRAFTIEELKKFAAIYGFSYPRNSFDQQPDGK